MSLPAVTLGPHRVTRLIVGGNPFVGNSHLAPEMDRDMREYYSAERVVEALRACETAGINTVQARGDYHRVLHWIELFRRQGGTLQWVAQTASEMHDGFQNIRVLAAAGAIAIYHHGTRTDNLWHDGRIDQVRDSLACMRDSGVVVGLGTHIPEVVAYAEEHGWDVDFYMTSLYNLGRTPRESAVVSGRPDFTGELFLESDREAMYKAIRATRRTCLVFKILGASRRCGDQEEVRAAFRETFANIKPQDAVVVGMFTKYADQVRLNVRYTLESCGLV